MADSTVTRYGYDPQFGARDINFAQLGEQQRQFNERLKFYQTLSDQWNQQQTGTKSLVDQYYQSFNAAKQEQDLRRQQQLGLLDTTTGQRAADIRSSFQQKEATGLQNLARLGTGNTTLRNSVISGNARDQSFALNTLADQMQQTKLGVLGQQVQYPDTAVTTSLINAYAPRQTYPSF